MRLRRRQQNNASPALRHHAQSRRQIRRKIIETRRRNQDARIRTRSSCFCQASPVLISPGRPLQCFQMSALLADAVSRHSKRSPLKTLLRLAFGRSANFAAVLLPQVSVCRRRAIVVAATFRQLSRNVGQIFERMFGQERRGCFSRGRSRSRGRGHAQEGVWRRRVSTVRT